MRLQRDFWSHGGSFAVPLGLLGGLVAWTAHRGSEPPLWLGILLLAWLVAMGVGRVVGAIMRGRLDRAVYKAVWPVSAAGYAFLFDALGLPPWATFFVSVIAASLTRSALGGVLPGRRRWTRTVEWRRIDLDELLP